MERRIKTIDCLNESKDLINKLCFALSSVHTTDKDMVEDMRAKIIFSIDESIDQLTKKIVIGNK